MQNTSRTANDKLPLLERCSSCWAARQTQGLHRMYDALKCIYCTARLIQQIGKLPIAQTEVTARRRAVLQGALACGLSETQIRKLVRGPMALTPTADRR